jgi:CMP-N,N'-diacetyllegionaminic acid synthase
MRSIVAFIPARSQSKRAPHKNIRLFGGHPMLARAIAAARQSGIFTAVVVSTDDPLYADIARHYGAEVPALRPAEISGDLSPDVEWVVHMLDTLEQANRRFDCFSILRPTNPFRTAETIRRAWRVFSDEVGVDSLRAVELCKQHPGKMWVVRGKRMLPLLPLTPPEQPWHSSQYQALPKVYVQNASLEIATTRTVREGGNIAGASVVPFFTDGLEGTDVNSEAEWEQAVERAAANPHLLPPVEQSPFPVERLPAACRIQS